MTNSKALVPALAARYGIQETEVIYIATAILKDIHRVAVQSEYGPTGAIYECKWLLGEEAQYHLTGIVIEMLNRHAPGESGELADDIFRYVSPERDLWNEELNRWLEGRHPTRVAIDKK